MALKNKQKKTNGKATVNKNSKDSAKINSKPTVQPKQEVAEVKPAPVPKAEKKVSPAPVKKNSPVKKAVEAIVNTPEAKMAHINPAEEEALTAQQIHDESKQGEVSTEKLEKAVEVIQQQFNLAGGKYVVNTFVDKGTKCDISVSNEDFTLIVTIKDTEKFDIR
jgi:hypothetical protein